METIARKTLLYKSGLGFWCVNHAVGCSHGCKYPCYAYMMAKTYGRAKDYADWCRPKLVAHAAELLDTELEHKRKKPESINLCLTTDPFMVGYPEISAMSLKLIAVANGQGVACSTLTKGLYPIELADRGRFPLENVHGISLVSLDEGFRKRWEPGAAPYAERILALKALHDAGSATYAHIEPYPTPNLIAQDLSAILQAVGFVDKIYFGGWNYNALATGFPDRLSFYDGQAEIVGRFCAERGIEFR
ncbi:MAG: radical SAM protein [Spirochaetes bacterium]|nr:radical SAM protein [Spirochaetota bacterium]